MEMSPAMLNSIGMVLKSLGLSKRIEAEIVKLIESGALQQVMEFVDALPDIRARIARIEASIAGGIASSDRNPPASAIRGHDRLSGSGSDTGGVPDAGYARPVRISGASGYNDPFFAVTDYATGD